MAKEDAVVWLDQMIPAHQKKILGKSQLNKDLDPNFIS
jgi:hypothetical protein